MKLFLSFAIVFVSIVACKKSNSNQSLQGAWVETTLRLDTIDFNNAFPSSDGKSSLQLKSKPYMDLAQNPTYPVNHSSIFFYYFEGAFIYLHNYLSSTMTYNPYDFKIADGNKRFSIKRFYNRNSLPNELQFEKIN